MVVSEEVALKTAELLLQIKAIKLDTTNHFTWASGWKSPIYCDNRIVLSYPKVRTYVRQQLADVITDKFGTPDLIAGVATGAIAHGVLTAQAMELPFIYVRPKPKEHGMGNQIEGLYEPGQSVVVIEDLVSTGNSSLSAVEALRDAGCKVLGMVSIFNYCFSVAEASFTRANCQLFSLCDYDSLLKQAVAVKFIRPDQTEALQQWRSNPEKWEPITV